VAEAAAFVAKQKQLNPRYWGVAMNPHPWAQIAGKPAFGPALDHFELGAYPKILLKVAPVVSACDLFLLSVFFFFFPQSFANIDAHVPDSLAWR
jgi:hypothetical protein